MRLQTLKYAMAIFMVMALVAAGIVFSLPYLVSTDAIRIRLAQDLSAWTGYNVQLREAPKLQLFPYPRASLPGVTLTPYSDDAAPLMVAERIDVDLSIWDALLGRVSFSETRIIHPHFIMDEPVKTVADFFNNLSRSQGTFGSAIRDARTLVEQNPDQPDTAKLLKQPFGRIVVEDGELLYRETVGGMAGKITSLNATMDWPDSTRSASFRASARWHGQLTELKIDAGQALLLLAGGNSNLRVSFNSIKGGATFEGNARLAEHYFFDGKLSARSPGWNQSLEWLGLVRNFGQGLIAPMVWESRFTAQPERVQLNDIVTTLGADKARGALEINNQDQIPMTTGSLAFDSLDLNVLASAFFPDEDKNEPLDLTVLDWLGLDIRISAPEAKFGRVDMTSLAAAIQIRNGKAIFDLGNANAFGGNLQSNIQIGKKDDSAQIEARIAGASLNMSDVARTMGKTTAITAKTGFILNMKAPLSRWSEIVSQMNGQLTLNLSSGQYFGYQFDSWQSNLNAQDQFTMISDGNVSTPFEQWNIEGTFSPGLFKITKSSFKTKEWEILLQGDVILPPANNKENAQQTQLDLHAKLQKNNRSDNLCDSTNCILNSLSRPVPFDITGTPLEMVVNKTVPKLQ